MLFSLLHEICVTPKRKCLYGKQSISIKTLCKSSCLLNTKRKRKKSEFQLNFFLFRQSRARTREWSRKTLRDRKIIIFADDWARNAKASPVIQTPVSLWICFRFPVASSLSFRAESDERTVCPARRQVRRRGKSFRCPSSLASTDKTL